MENLVQTVEAILFAAGVPISRKEIMEKLPDDVSRKNLNDAVDKLAQKYSGDSGILLQQFEDKLQFCSNDKYGDIVSVILQPVKEKELTKSLMEVLSIIAYFQPIKKSTIEEYRGGGDADYALSMLQKADLIYVSGYAQTPGRPMLYSTTDGFLKKFDLRDLSDLPGIEEVKQRMIELGNFNAQREGLYREDGMDLSDDIEEKTDYQLQQEAEFEDEFGAFDDEDPEFLKDDNIEEYSGDDNEVGELEDRDIEKESIEEDDSDEMPF